MPPPDREEHWAANTTWLQSEPARSRPGREPPMQALGPPAHRPCLQNNHLPYAAGGASLPDIPHRSGGLCRGWRTPRCCGHGVLPPPLPVPRCGHPGTPTHSSTRWMGDGDHVGDRCAAASASSSGRRSLRIRSVNTGQASWSRPHRRCRGRTPKHMAPKPSSTPPNSGAVRGGRQAHGCCLGPRVTDRGDRPRLSVKRRLERAPSGKTWPCSGSRFRRLLGGCADYAVGAIADDELAQRGHAEAVDMDLPRRLVGQFDERDH